MENLKFTRSINIKKISFDSLDKTSELMTLFKKNQLTKEKLLNSPENLFVIAFFYDNLFDIVDYLKYLISQPITNQSYNVIKTYARKLSHSSVCKLFDSSPIQAVLKGEIYRICKMEIDDFSPFFIYGFCTSGNILLPNFEETFEKCIEKSLDLLLLLDFSEERVYRTVIKNINSCFDYLISRNIFDKVICHIDFSKLIDIDENDNLKKYDRICRIFKCSNLIDTAVQKLKELSSNEIIEIAVIISEERMVYSKIKELVLEHIKDLKSLEHPKTILQFLFIVLYYDFSTFDRTYISEICTNFGCSNNDEYKLLLNDQSYQIKGDLLEKIKNCHSFTELTKLFAEFMILAKQGNLTLGQILDLPEKFFSFALNLINSESAKNLKIFNDNLLNERLKESVYKKIDQKDFAFYLIKRYKTFPVDLTGYEYLMDGKYKQMYGLLNLKWASDHIDELKYNLTDRLYRALKNSHYSECLSNIQYSENISIKFCSPSNKVLEFLESENTRHGKKFKTVDIAFDNNSDSSESTVIENNTTESDKDNHDAIEVEEYSSEESVNMTLLNNSNQIIQAIYDQFKSEDSNFGILIKDFKDSKDFEYALDILFGFTSKNKKIEKFYKFFIDSIVHFTIEYGKHKEMIRFLFEKFRDFVIFENCAFSIQFSDLKSFICDFPYTEPIYKGLGKRIEACEDQNDYTLLVKDLVFSNSIPSIIIGSKLFSLFKSPGFNLNHLLSFKRDEVVYEAIKQLNSSNYNNELVPILLNRGLTDEMSALICQKLDHSQLSEKNLQRIYSLFYLNPLNFIKFEIYKFGFSLDEHIVLDLIKSISTSYSESIFEKVSPILARFEFTQSCYDQMISSLDTSNSLFKDWVFENLRTENISLPFFVKLCWYVCNEDDIAYVEKAIRVLKNGRIFDIIEKWAKIKKFERLIRRVYPLRLIDREFYFRIFDNCTDENEKRILRSIYDF